MEDNNNNNVQANNLGEHNDVQNNNQQNNLEQNNNAPINNNLNQNNINNNNGQNNNVEQNENNNNQNQNNSNNNQIAQANNNVPINNVQNNNGLQAVKLHMLVRWGDNVGTVGDIQTNNSIAIWYALKITMRYLQSRTLGVTEQNKLIIHKLDPLVKQNLVSISSYLKELNIDTKDIDGLAKDLDEPVDEINDKIKLVLNNHQGKNKSIEDLVFDKLIEKEADKNNEIINNEIIGDKGKILLVKHDFDDLKGTIQTGNQARDEKVFLSKAAKEFQNKVKDLELVKEGNERDDKRKKYNEAVKKLDEAIKLAIENAIKDERSSSEDGYIKSKVPDILNKLGLKNDKDNNKNNIINNINQQNDGKMEQDNIEVPKNAGDANRVGDFELLADKSGVIQGESEKKLLSELSERIKEHLTEMRSDGDQKKYIKEFLGQDGEGDVWKSLQNCWTQRKNLAESDRKKIKYDGAKIENDNKDNKKDDGLINIANDTQIKEITQEYDEYNSLVARKLFDNSSDIDVTMEKFIENVLLQDPKDDEECKKARGNLKGMISQVNEQLAQVKNNEQYKQYEGKYLQVILRLDKKMGPNDVEVKQRKFFVPTFIKQLFNVNSQDNLKNLADNLEALGNDKTFQTFLSNIMQDDFAVDMIKNNFEQIEKDFKDADYKVTRRAQFKKEFWDNNLKGHLPFFGEWTSGKRIKNLVMLGVESFGGFALGSALAAKLGLSLAGAILPAIGAAAVILVTAIAIAVLVSLIITLVKGFRNLKNDGFYKPSKNDQESTKTSQTAYLNRIYTAFLTFGADEQKLKNLVTENNRKGLDKKSPQGKFFKSMVDMKKFLEENAKKYEETKGLVEKNAPFQKLKKILEEKNQPPAQDINNQNNQNNEDINIPQ